MFEPWERSLWSGRHSRFALDPSVEQEALLASFTGASRFWSNQGLALVKERLDARARGEDVRVPVVHAALLGVQG